MKLLRAMLMLVNIRKIIFQTLRIWILEIKPFWKLFILFSYHSNDERLPYDSNFIFLGAKAGVNNLWNLWYSFQ